MLRLIIHEPGKDPKEFELGIKTYSLGRGEENDIVFFDKTVSRKHARIFFEDKAFFIEALESKAGVLVNGKQIHKKTPLDDGCEVALGSTRIEIAELDIEDTLRLDSDSDDQTELMDTGSFPDVDAGNKDIPTLDYPEIVSSHSGGKKENALAGKKRKMLLIGVLAVFCVFLIIILMAKPSKKTAKVAPKTVEQKTAKNDMKPLTAPAKGPSNEKLIAEKTAEIYFNTAKELADNKIWKDAIVKYKMVLKINPAYPGLQEAIQKAKFESINHFSFEKAKSLISEGKYQEGINEFKVIPEESIYYDEALIEIQTALAEMKKEKSRKSLLELTKKAVAAETKGRNLIKKALEYYTRGKIDLAISSLASISDIKLKSDSLLITESSSLKGKISEEKNLYARGLDEYNKKQIDRASKTWNRALDIDREITGGKGSYYSNRITSLIADEFYGRAKEALKTGNYEEANMNSDRALKSRPDHKGSLEIRDFLVERARKLFEEGYVVEKLDPEKAIKKWKEVVKICPPSSVYYKKARSNLYKYKR